MSLALREVLLQADALLRQREAGKARNLLDRFAAGNVSASSSVEFHAMLAQACLQDGDAGEAVRAIDGALALRPEWADAQQIRALALRDCGRLDEAAQAID